MTTHLVTNGTLPERLEAMNTLPSHLFVSLYAPDERTYLKTCRPVVTHGWAKVNNTLRLLPSLQCPSTVELTLVKGLNMIKAKEYAKLIEVADPVTVHLKVVQRVGEAMKRIPVEAVPEWEEVEKFAEQISNETGYDLKDKAFPYAILLAR
jgi:tRNA wybutosine-synthesizing protein 1